MCLSQNLFGKQLQEYEDLVAKKLEKNIFYFVASGIRDATSRIESGAKLDSIFNLNQNKKLITKHTIYDSDHGGVAGRGLNDGISHVFSFYKHYNGWDELFLDSLSKNKINPYDFVINNGKQIEATYGVNFEFDQNDLWIILEFVETDEDVKKLEDFEIKHLGKSEEFYAGYAQNYERVKSYEKALTYWKENLKNDYDHNNHFFYSRRPIELLNDKMKEPKRAIEFALQEREKRPQNKLYYEYMIAKIASQNKIKQKIGLKSIRFCISNFKENAMFELEEAKTIEKRLLK